MNTLFDHIVNVDVFLLLKTVLIIVVIMLLMLSS